MPKRQNSDPAELPLLSRPVVPGGNDERIRSLVEMFEGTAPETAAEEVSAMFRLMESLSASPQWQIVYELANGKIHFRTQVDQSGRRIRSIGFSDFTGSGDADCRKALWKESKTGVTYVSPAMRTNLATSERSEGEKALSRQDFPAAHDTPSLLSESRRFLISAGLTASLLDGVYRYNGTHTACVMRD